MGKGAGGFEKGRGLERGGGCRVRRCHTGREVFECSCGLMSGVYPRLVAYLGLLDCAGFKALGGWVMCVACILRHHVMLFRSDWRVVPFAFPYSLLWEYGVNDVT